MRQPELQTMIRSLTKMLKRSQPTNDYQRGFHDALALVRRDACALVEHRPAPSWTDHPVAS